MLESSKTHAQRATRLAKNKLYPFLRETVPGTTVNVYYAWLSTVFGYLFWLTTCLQCASLSTASAAVLSLFHFLPSSFTFHFNSIQPFYAPGYVCLQSDTTIHLQYIMLYVCTLCTRFWFKPARVYPFLVIALILSIPFSIFDLLFSLPLQS